MGGFNKVKHINFYKLLNVDQHASESSIRSAYRKQAKNCHPDKSGDPSSVDQFHLLSEALEVLTIKDKRLEYDELLKCQQEKEKAVQKRGEELVKQNVRTSKLKEQLREREENGKISVHQEKYQDEVIRSYRNETRKLIEEEQDLLIEKLNNLILPKEKEVEEKPIIKLKWSKEGSQYTEPFLRKIFGKYGEVENIVLKKRSALVEFKHLESAILAAKAEIGLEDSPLVLKPFFPKHFLSKYIFVKYECAKSWPEDVCEALREMEKYIFGNIFSPQKDR